MKMTSDLRIIVLGAAAGGGLPQWNCGCRNCQMARNPASTLRPQTQSSLAVTVDGQSWTVFNASPDLRQQLKATRALQPQGLRDTPIRSVVLTNADIDHIAGLLVLREKQAFSLHATRAVAATIDANPVFRVLDPTMVSRHCVSLEEPFFPLPGLEVRLFSVPGKVPLYLEDGEPEVGIESEQTVGLELKSGETRVYYIPGCSTLPDILKARLADADALFFDGTLFRDDEMIATGTGRKTGRRMGHMPIDGEDGSLQALRPLNVGRKIYIHINNTNPIWQPGPERDAVERAGIEIGYDGMEICL